MRHQETSTLYLWYVIIHIKFILEKRLKTIKPRQCLSEKAVLRPPNLTAWNTMRWCKTDISDILRDYLPRHDE